VVTSIFVVGVVLWVKCSHLHEEHQLEADRERYQQERIDEGKPRKVELPGMTIIAPGAGQQSGDYEHGLLTGAAPVEFGVQWQRHGTIERSMVVKLIVSSYDKANHWRLAEDSNRDLEVAGLAAHEDSLKTPDGAQMFVTQLECGKRQVTIIVDGIQQDLRRYNDKMVGSFHCAPDSTIDLDRPPVVVDAVKGWVKSRANHESHLLALDGPHGEVLRGAKLGPREGSVADVITGLVDNTAIRLTSKPTTRNDKVFWQGVDADNKPAAVLAWRCDDDRVALITIVAPKSVDDAVAVADTGRCLGPDDAVPAY
jgi:hypothetical protein